eukprot:CAMPEP_0201513610 /NCGR_PEP_ID=MMETSP0161_2-20130828/5641_1 /ASSEMBLY_ACC=CAM_ASM_000251 /TAXON_ID=180227 /ORGANISM="Neoparamoeba aestuarina, Strain SoJaBio B1-5/56/2" /LENGTH=268 /DNA_ID=CAMNT_0047909905 /DNA_START=32 /DNA_END=838 /DNA_ORIENTATION=-
MFKNIQTLLSEATAASPTAGVPTLSESFRFPLNGAQRYLVESLGRYYGLTVTSIPHKGSELAFSVQIHADKKLFVPNQSLSSILSSSEKLTSMNSRCLLFTHLKRGAHQPLQSLFAHYLSSFKGQYTAHILDENTAFLDTDTMGIGRSIRHQLQSSRVHHVSEYYDITTAPQSLGSSSSSSSLSSFTSLSSIPVKKTSFSSWNPSAAEEKGKEKEKEKEKEEQKEGEKDEGKGEQKKEKKETEDKDVVDDWTSLLDSESNTPITESEE